MDIQPIIAVDDQISGVKRALEESGYQVQDLSKGLEQTAVIVVNGLDNNVLGMQDIVVDAPVIDAAGRDIDEIVADVRRVVELRT
ncbi:MAG: YkuS family protein [Firmicutes bacterium]|nr:YkuS family protein [Bacillota bacterium]